MMAAELLERPTVDIDPFSDDFIADPYPFHKRMRDIGPLLWVKSAECWFVSADAVAREILNDPTRFCSSAGIGHANFHKEVPWRLRSLLIESDPPEHTEARGLFAKVLTPLVVRDLRVDFEREAAALVARMLDGHVFEAKADLAQAFPLKAFADAIGIREDGRINLVPWGDMTFNAMGPKNKYFDEAMSKFPPVSAWINDSCRKENLQPGKLGYQLHERAAEAGKDPAYATTLVRGFLSAGIDTTAYSFASALWLFATHKDQWTYLRQNPTEIRAAYEEVLRFKAPLHSFFRTATVDCEVAGVRIQSGDKILVSLGAIGRDAARWPDPNRFDVTRKPVGQAAFGHGIHACLGQMMARLEFEVLFTEIARHVRDIEIADDPDVLMHNTLHGFSRLPLRFQT